MSMDSTAGPAPVPHGCTPACSSENVDLISEYFRTQGCGVTHIRAALPNIDRANIRPWTAFRADVLYDLFRHLGDHSDQEDPDKDDGGAFNPETEGDWYRLVNDCVVPRLRPLIRPANQVLESGLPITTIEASLQHDWDKSPQPRAPVPEVCILGCDPRAGPASMVVFAAGNVTMGHCISSESLTKYVAGEDLPERNATDMTDALRHMARISLVARTRYGFLITPTEVIVLRFALDDDLDEKSMHVEWASATFVHRNGPSNFPEALAPDHAIACLAFISIWDHDRAVKRRSLMVAPINGWKKDGDDYVSVVNPRRRETSLPSCGVLAE